MLPGRRASRPAQANNASANRMSQHTVFEGFATCRGAAADIVMISSAERMREQGGRARADLVEELGGDEDLQEPRHDLHEEGRVDDVQVLQVLLELALSN